MNKFIPVISGIGVVSPIGVEKDAFFNSLFDGKNVQGKISNFQVPETFLNAAFEIRNFDASVYLGAKGLRNIDRGSLMLLTASKLAMDEAKLVIDSSNTDKIGVCTGTTFAHITPIVDFDREVLTEGLNFANPALFPPTVVNAASSQISIKFNIQGYNTTISTGYTAGLDALKYAINSIETGKVETALVGGVDTLSLPVYLGFNHLGYIAGKTGPAVSCPFDMKRNGPVYGEGAAVIIIESALSAKKRGAKIYASLKSVVSFYDAAKMAKIHPAGEGLERSISGALDSADIHPLTIDYISSSANSSVRVDKIETRVFKKVFGDSIYDKPVSSIKSMLGETFSPSSIFQIISCIGAMERGLLPPTINYADKDPELDLDFVPNQARKNEVRTALVSSTGPGGYNAAAVIEKYEKI